MNKSTWINLLLVAGVIALVVIPLAFVSGEFGGSDDQGTALITASHPNYKPWFSSLYEPPSDEVASGLFAAQAAIGGAVLGYYFGVARTRRRLGAGATGSAPEAPEGSSEPVAENP
jgi:cobalt/nickel transport protein